MEELYKDFINILNIKSEKQIIKECMTQKDSYIKNYKKRHPNDSKKINAYKRNIKEQFKDLESATEYVASMYVDYFAYGLAYCFGYSFLTSFLCSNSSFFLFINSFIFFSFSHFCLSSCSCFFSIEI